LSSSNLPEADIVQVDTEWVRRFHAILDILQRSIAIGAALLGAAIIVIIGNTIRLDIQNRHEEIEVTKLIGASDAFVRRPFLYSGLWYGLGRSVVRARRGAFGIGPGSLRSLRPRGTRYPAGRTVQQPV
jgi:cell division transport system permease protein